MCEAILTNQTAPLKTIHRGVPCFITRLAVFAVTFLFFGITAAQTPATIYVEDGTLVAGLDAIHIPHSSATVTPVAVNVFVHQGTLIFGLDQLSNAALVYENAKKQSNVKPLLAKTATLTTASQKPVAQADFIAKPFASKNRKDLYFYLCHNALCISSGVPKYKKITGSSVSKYLVLGMHFIKNSRQITAFQTKFYSYKIYATYFSRPPPGC